MRRLLPLLLLLAFVGCNGHAEPRSASRPIKANGTEYIPRSRIIFSPEGSRTPEVHYPNGEVKAGAFTAPPGARALFANPFHQYVTQRGLTLQRDEEGFESCPYWDAYGGVWTIGIGEAYVSASTPCESEYTAYRKLEHQDAVHYSWPIWDLNTAFTHNQFDALIDFDYNLGPYIFQISPAITYDLRHRAFYSAWAIMDGYDKAGGVVLGDLYRRRLHERALFFLPEAPPCTGSCLRQRREHELAADESTLVGLRGRILVLRRVLLTDGCDRRRQAHLGLGPRCSRWFREGAADHSHGRQLDGSIVRLRRELA